MVPGQLSRKSSLHLSEFGNLSLFKTDYTSNGSIGLIKTPTPLFMKPMCVGVYSNYRSLKLPTSRKNSNFMLTSSDLVAY